MSDVETAPYIVRRVGLRWRIYHVGEDDNIVRPIHPSLRFWRWITAARLASCMAQGYRIGKYWRTPPDFPPEEIVWMGQRVGDMDRDTLIKFIQQLDWRISEIALVMRERS